MNRLLTLMILVVAFVANATAQGKPSVPDIVVSKDGKGQFSTIQEAILSVRDYKPSRTTIFVRKGRYEEKLLIPANKCDITIIGENAEEVIITHGDYASLNNMGTFNTWTVRVDGDGIRMENLTIENSAGAVGQAVALHVEGDRCEFAKCRILGNQDTVFNGGNNSRQYFKQCYIEGTTDFLFGSATVWMDKCEIHCKSDSYITAASTPEGQMGYVLADCKVTADAKVSKLYLGRPWRAFANVIFLRCELPSAIRPEGWHNWGRTENENTATYVECACTGPGAKTDGRVSWSHKFDNESEMNTLSHSKAFNRMTLWTPGYADNNKQ